MKKIFSKEIFLLPLFLLLTLFVSVNKVNADTSSVYVSDFYSNINIYSSLDSSIVSNLTTYYVNNFQSTYNYYFIYYSNNQLILTATNNNSFYWYSSSYGFYNSGYGPSYVYNLVTEQYSTSNISTFINTLLYYTSDNFTLKDHTNCEASISSRCIDEVQLPMYSNLSLGFSFPQYNIVKDYLLPTYTTLVNGTFVNGPTGTTGSSGLVITDIFTNPIRTLESVWTSIVNIFNLIGEFIALIPSPLREFLISAFMLAIILGILKILL